MKVIFLDVDGVLNDHAGLSRYGIHYIDNSKVALLKAIVFATGAEIVLSSTWRILNENYVRVHSVLLSHGMDIYDVTPQLFSGSRGSEIRMWLANPPMKPSKIAILDDDISAGEHGDPNFFRTNFNEGLTEEIAERIIKHLGQEKQE